MDIQRHHVFVADSYEGCRRAVQALLVNAEFTVHAFDNSEACLESLSDVDMECDAVITGLKLLPIGGLQLIRSIKAIRPSVPIIVHTSSATVPLAVKALKMGIYDFIEKPVKAEYLIASVQNAIAQHSGEHLPLKSLLSRTEYEVLMHMLNGESTKEIALTRRRSIRTIEDQRLAIMKKLHVDNAIELVKRAAYVVMPDK